METLLYMKSILTVALISTILTLTNCKKSDSTTNTRVTLSALQATWTFKSSRCYQDPNIVVPLLSPTYFAFNSDMSAAFYSPGAVSLPFSYNLLADDSTLITQYNTPPLYSIPDTFIIIKITPTELVYHGKNTYSHTSSNCINGNTLDSLYK